MTYQRLQVSYLLIQRFRLFLFQVLSYYIIFCSSLGVIHIENLRTYTYPNEIKVMYQKLIDENFSGVSLKFYWEQ